MLKFLLAHKLLLLVGVGAVGVGTVRAVKKRRIASGRLPPGTTVFGPGTTAANSHIDWSAQKASQQGVDAALFGQPSSGGGAVRSAEATQAGKHMSKPQPGGDGEPGTAQLPHGLQRHPVRPNPFVPPPPSSGVVPPTRGGVASPFPVSSAPVLTPQPHPTDPTKALPPVIPPHSSTRAPIFMAPKRFTR